MSKVQTDQLLSKDFRIEGPWTEKIETLLNTWRIECLKKSKQHEKAGYLFKKKNTRWGLPPVLIPIIMSPVSVMIGYNSCENDESQQWKTILNSSAFLVAGIFSGVYSFFRYGEKMENFFNFSTRYVDIVTEIDSELIKDEDYRLPADVFLMRIKMLIDNLTRTEPVIPSGIANENIDIPDLEDDTRADNEVETKAGDEAKE